MSDKKMVNPRNAYGEVLVELGKKKQKLGSFGCRPFKIYKDN